MKPGDLERKLEVVSVINVAYEKVRTYAETALIAEKRERVILERERLIVLQESGELSSVELALEYAKTITSVCNRARDEDTTKSAEITVQAAEIWGFGLGKAVAVLTAHSAVTGPVKKTRPENGGPVSSYTIVIGFAPDNKDYHPSKGFINSLHQKRLRYRMPAQFDAPNSSKAILEVENLDMQGIDPVMTKDFLDWAVVLLDKAGDPLDAPQLYAPNALEREKIRAGQIILSADS
jgi:hypothetical protein